MTPRFEVGARVRVKVAYPRHHCRTPYYCRGKTGQVERLCGEFRNPETLAYGEKGLPLQPLYRVRFRQSELWPDYAGPQQDVVEIEIYEGWLEPAATEGQDT